MRPLLIALILSACTTVTPSPPTVHLSGTVDRNTELGLRVWESMGFERDDASDLEECPRHWPDAVDRCQLTITLGYVGYLERDTGAIGWAHLNERTIEIDSYVKGATDGSRIFAHELGHVLLDAGHLPDGQHGVMQAIGAPWTEEPWPRDRDLACRSVGLCEGP